MQTKWFQPASWRTQEASNTRTGSTSPQPGTTSSENSGKQTAAENPGAALPPGDLLPFDDVYRTAGIKSPRMGYSITKVIEMLQSEHIRHLPTETRRASVLMALEAAGVQADEVLQDATIRQRALNSYEAIQRKHLEEYEARKGQENCAIQAEMDRVTAQYLARINSNVDEVAREKDGFRKWQNKKQHEAQRIAEAVALCVAPSGPDSQAEPITVLRELAALPKTAFAGR